MVATSTASGPGWPDDREEADPGFWHYPGEAAGRMKLPDLDSGGFIPLPPRLGLPREPEPMT